MEEDVATQQGFVQRRLPWIVAACALLLYLVTLNNWPTFQSVSPLARATGLDWRPNYVAPVYFLLTYPVRWLPEGGQLLALNLLSLACSVLSLTLLARSVALLPHDRTKDQRVLEQSDYSLLTIPAAWLPPLLAAVVCGLQLTFWEHAIGASTESLDLLLFAYVVRCILEFRISEKDSWLVRAAFVFAAGMANNFAMIALFPCFLVSVFWVKGLAFFEWRFLSRMALFGFVGLLFYLVLPLYYTLSELSPNSLFEILRTALGFQKSVILAYPRYVFLFIALSSLIPILFIGIRWPSLVGDISSAGVAISNLMMHVMHGVFLVYCIAVAFDPVFSPRNIGGGWPFLPMYYLGALAVGYCAGYFLLVFGTSPDPKLFIRTGPLRQILNKAITVLIWGGAVAVSGGLLYQNFNRVRVSSGRSLGDFAEACVQHLPRQGAVVFSDDPFRLYAIEAALKASGAGGRFLLVDTKSLASPGYHRHLKRQFGERWPGLGHQRPWNETIDEPSLASLVTFLAQSNQLFYVHPSFGYFFEWFSLKPEGPVYRMEMLPTNAVSGPTLTPQELQLNDDFWKKFIPAKLEDLRAQVRKRPTTERQAAESVALYLGAMYSRAINFLGAALQRAGNREKAAEYFALALSFNTNNPAAFINLDYSKLLRAGQRDNPEPSEGAKRRLAPYGGNWDAILNFNGPVEEPYSCFLLAQSLARGRNYRQAAQNLERTVQYLPENLVARLALANACVRAGLTDESFRILKAIRAQTQGKSLQPADDVALIQVEAYALATTDQLPAAVQLLTDAQNRYPNEELPYTTLSELYLAGQQITNAMAVLEKQLVRQPENVAALNNYGLLYMRLGQYDKAVPLLGRALKIQATHPESLLNRAIANFQLGNLDAAQADYEALQNSLPRPSYAVSFGLGEIAFRKKNVRTALRHYTKFLELAPPGVPEREQVRQRIKLLKSGSI